MTHGLGVFWAVSHRRPQDYAYFEKMEPPVFKIQDGGLPDYDWARAHLPGALVVARDWALGEQKSDMRRAPEETGKRHAQEWKKRQAALGFDGANTLVLGINEPEVWGVDGLSAAQCIDRVVRYTVAFLDECKALGLRGGALQLSVGWPANTGTDTPPDWAPYAPVRDAILRGKHALVLHEYWADLGPQEHWGWWGGRALKCPWQVPIVIGECGFEMAVKKSPLKPHERGWQSYISPAAYAQQLIEYANRMAGDSRILGVCPFLSDYQNNEWQTLDVEPAYGDILARRAALKPIATAAPAGSHINAPAGANVRETPSTSATILRRLPLGTQVQPVATNAERTWLALADGGWVYATLVSGAPAGLPVQTPPVDLFARVMTFILRWEGGFVHDSRDAGGATNMGITIGTLTAWRQSKALPAATVEDVRNLTKAEALEIYRARYWGPSGAEKATDYRTALLLMDSGVLHGVGAAQAWVKEYGRDPWRIAARRLRVYAGKDATQWGAFGRAWVKRTADLLTEMGAE